jgi:hypothetical protein
MVFMGDGGSEQRHDAVSQHLVHRALKAVDRIHHDVDSRIQELLGGFRVEIFNQLGGVFDVCQKHGDLLALALQSAAGGEDLIG